MSENQNIEWKESWRDEYLKWICGFANAAGGKIYIGTDDNGKVVGVLFKPHQLQRSVPLPQRQYEAGVERCGFESFHHAENRQALG